VGNFYTRRESSSFSGKTLFHIVSYLYELKGYVQIPVAVQYKAWVCGRLLAGIVGSNPARDMDVCLLLVLCVVR